MGGEAWAAQADAADETAGVARLHRPQAEAAVGEMVPDAGHLRIAFRPAQHLGQELGDTRVGVQRRKRRRIPILPGAQDQAICRDDRVHGAGRYACPGC